MRRNAATIGITRNGMDASDNGGKKTAKKKTGRARIRKCHRQRQKLGGTTTRATQDDGGDVRRLHAMEKEGPSCNFCNGLNRNGCEGRDRGLSARESLTERRLRDEDGEEGEISQVAERARGPQANIAAETNTATFGGILRFARRAKSDNDVASTPMKVN